MGILSGLRVLDLSRVLAGPWSSQTLGDLGCEVIKVEHPVLGDETRHWGPPYAGDKAHGVSAYFSSTNRNKKSLAVDIAAPEGQEIIRSLCRTADVVIENFKTGGLKKYALDYPSLRKINDKLIYCSITGFGQTGPEAHRPGYDLMIQAVSGLMSITGEANHPPVKVGVAVCDIFTGLYSTIAILAALQERQISGKGQHIDMALFNVGLSVLANQTANYLIGDQTPQPMGSAHPNIVPYQAFATADGHILLAVGNDKQFAALGDLPGLADLASDPLYATNDVRVQNRDKLVPKLADALSKHSTDFWVQAFEKAAIPFSPINNIAQAFAEPQAIAQNMVETLHHEKYGDIRLAASPLRFGNKESQPAYDIAPPLLGEHTAEILKSHLNMADETIKTLCDKGIIKI